MNREQGEFAATWKGPYGESYFARMAALEDAPHPAAPGTAERDRSDKSDGSLDGWPDLPAPGKVSAQTHPHWAESKGQAAFVSAQTPVPGRAETNLRFRSAREIGETEPAAVPWVAPPWVASGAITELVGKIKAAGKTTWSLALVRAVLDGEPFLGEPTARTGVVYITEQSPTTFRDALRRAGLLDRDDLTALFWRDTIGVPWPTVAAAGIAECERRGAGLLVVDTLGQFAGLRGDAENSAGDALAAVQPLQAAAANGLAVLIVRHERKSGGEVGESGRGSSAFAGAVDIVLSLRRGEGNSRPTIRHLHALSRFDETPDTLVVELTEHGYVALGDETAVALQEASAAARDALPATAEHALTFDELRAGLPGVPRTTLQRALDALRARGEVQRIGEGKRGDPHRYFAPDPEPPADRDAGGRFVSAHLEEQSGQKAIEPSDGPPEPIPWPADADTPDPVESQREGFGPGGAAVSAP